MTGEEATTPATPQAKHSLFPGWGARIIVALCLIATIALRRFDRQVQAAIPVIDPAVINIITLVLGFVALASLVGWFLLRSGYSRSARQGVAIGLVVLLVVAVATLRIDGVDGDMTPRFAWRWTKTADHGLAAIQPASAPAAVDLTKPTGDDFPQFLGPSRTAYLPGLRLERDWTAYPPKLLWRQPIGAGWSAFSVVQDYAFTLEQRGPDEWVTCYEVETGKPVWGHSIPARHETTLGGIGPRSTPTVDEGRVYALGATGVLRCLDGATGNVLWQDDVLARVGVTPEQDLSQVAWGRAASPLIVDHRVIVPAGGKPGATHSLIAYDKTSGKVLWLKGNQQIAYASPVLATIGGQRQILIVNEDAVAGHDAETGDQLWTFPWPGSSSGNASCSQPVAFGGDQVFVSKGYGGGSTVHRIESAGDQWSATLVWENRRVLRTKFTNIAVIDGYVYGLSDGILECADIATGKSQWKKGRYGNGQLLGVGDTLLVISEDGELIHMEATPEAHRMLGKIQALDGQTWNNLCLSGRRLLVRNGQEAACYELSIMGD